jgi:hypothetical protein
MLAILPPLQRVIPDGAFGADTERQPEATHITLSSYPES